MDIIKKPDAIDSLISTINDDSAAKDFEKARNDINELVETTKDAINELALIAKQTQEPRAFEVLGKLIDSAVNASKSNLDLQAKIRTLSGLHTSVIEKSKTINNNLVFAGSTADLQKMLKEIGNNGPRDITPKQS